MSRAGTGRAWEIDFLRGTALLLMIIFHILYDLREFFGYPVPYDSGIYYYIGKTSGILFIAIAAVSGYFSHSNIRRAAKILALAALITLVTHLYNPDFGIKYGILHLLGTCILLFPLVRRMNKYVAAILGTIVIALGQYLGGVPVSHNYLFLFNLTNSSWVSADYYPLFPWFGVFVYGVVLGGILYPQKRSLFSFMPPRNPVSFLGQHTLLAYLIHQPLILLALGVIIKAGGAQG